MELKIGDYVTRSSYNNDTIFRIVDIKDEVILKGVDIRLFADAHINDLVKCDYINEDEDYINKIDIKDEMDRSEFFYLPAKILHIDSDISLSNNLLNPYKIREKAKNQKYINHQKKQKMSKI